MEKHKLPVTKNGQKPNRKLDPRYASARSWDWKLCLKCGALLPERCTVCGGSEFTKDPEKIISAAISKLGLP
jgi:hypothetical protein